MFLELNPLQTGSSYEVWANLYRVSSSRTGNEDGDAWTNEEEYFFGLNPVIHIDLGAPELNTDTQYPTYEYTYRTDTNGAVIYGVYRSLSLPEQTLVHENDGSGNIVNTETAVTRVGEPEDNGDGTSTITLQSQQSMEDDPSQFFKAQANEL